MKILITAGPTRENIDPVRFITNRSTGKMGYALAEAAYEADHEVTLVSGPVNLTAPEGVQLVSVESASDMAEAAHKASMDADIIIMSAAVADYRPKEISSSKIKKSDANLFIELERTEDIAASLGKNKKPGQILVGFAAETNDLIANAEDKIRKKNLDWIIANEVGKPDRGFASDKNAVTIISRDCSKIEIPLSSKKEIAKRIIEIILRNVTNYG